MLWPCLTLLLTTSAWGVSVDELVDLALKRSATLEAQELERRALESEARLKGKWSNPQLMSQIGSLKSGPTRGATLEVSVTQPIPLSNKFSLRTEMAEKALAQQREQGAYFQTWVRHQVLLSAWQVLVARELHEHSSERGRRIKLLKTYLETRPQVSVRQRVESNILQGTLLRMEQTLDQRAQALKDALSELCYWTGRELTAQEIELSIPSSLPVMPSLAVDTTHDRELLKAQRDHEMAKLDAEVARKEARPDLFVGAGYRIEDVTPVNHFSYGIIGLNIPLWDTGSERKAAAHARELKSQKILSDAERSSAARQRQLIYSLETAHAQLKRFPVSLHAKGEQAILEAERGFKQGVIDVNTFLTAEEQGHELLDQIHFSWIDYLRDLSLLQLSCGEEFSWKQ